MLVLMLVVAAVAAVVVLVPVLVLVIVLPRAARPDPSSQLMNNTVIPPIDINYSPSIREAAAPSSQPRHAPSKHSNVAVIVLATVLPVASVAAVAVACYVRRRKISEWVLWKVRSARSLWVHDVVLTAIHVVY